MEENETLSPLNRRGFVTAAAAAGYALAASPVTAWAITTPATDLDVADVKIPTGKEMMPAYVAKPKKPGKYPVVLVVHEIFGVHEYIRDVCRRLAHAGYVAVAPSLYFRQGDATKFSDIKELKAKIVDKVSQDQVLKDLDATTAWIASEKSADATKVAVTGFCWGGNVTWMYAEHNPRLKAGVAWYGRLVGDPSPNMAHYPVEGAKDLKVPVLGLYGEKDTGITLESIEKMRGALALGKSKSEILVFPGAEHGFHADYRPSYNEKSAQEGWAKLLAWFKAHGM